MMSRSLRMRSSAALALCSCILLPMAAVRAQMVDYTNHQLVRVRVASPADLQRIAEAGGEVLDCTPGPGTVSVHMPPGGYDRLLRAGFDAKLVLADMGPATTRHLQRAAGAGPFDDYMPLADISQYIHNLAALRPDLCSVSTIGFSVQNRPIEVLHITGPVGGNKPGVFYHGLQHCREWITGPTVLYLANHLVSNYDSDACIRDLVDRTHIYLAPCVNPDGYVYTWTTNRLWRKNRRNNGGSYGVDLNRNWGEGWGGEGSSGTPSSDTYRGPSAFSEPETQTLRDFISAHPEIRAHMDYHSYSQYILWPYGYTSAEPAEPDRSTFYSLGYRIQDLLLNVHANYYLAGPIYSTIYPTSGGSCDWSYAAQGVFGFSIELRPGADDTEPGFELPPDQILPTCEENLPAILHLTEFVSSDLLLESKSEALQRLTAGAAAPITLHVNEYIGSTVPGSVKMRYRYSPTAPFTEVMMTPAGSGDYTAELPATNCLAAPEVYFTATSTGGQTIAWPCGSPESALRPQMLPANTVFFAQNMDANPGWSVSGQWTWGIPTGGGGTYGYADPTAGHTGSRVYGYNLAGAYANNLAEQHLTTPAIDCTGKSGVRLSFWRWLGVEQPTYDHAYVRVSTNGSTWSTIWQNETTVADGAWVRQEFDISAIADNQPTVYLRWTMGTSDGAWAFCGWNIDDVQLWTAECAAAPGDWNGDMQVDAGDFPAFPPCVSGPTAGMAPDCGIYDFNSDGRIDLQDAADFFEALAP